ncbi:phosphatidylinositol 4,5-bisphosphate 5-phosphatase A-like protein, partial [Lates japonicus]
MEQDNGAKSGTQEDNPNGAARSFSSSSSSAPNTSNHRSHSRPASAPARPRRPRALRLQEVNSMINKRLKDVLFTDQWSQVCMERLSPFGYVLVTSQRMQGLLLLVFAKYYHLPFLRGVQTETTRTGLGGYW